VARPGHQGPHAPQVHQVGTVGPQEPVRNEDRLEPGERRAHGADAVVGVDERCAMLRLNEPDGLRRQRGSVVTIRDEQARHRSDQAGQAGPHPAHGVRDPRGGEWLHQVVRRIELKRGWSVVRVARGEHDHGPSVRFGPEARVQPSGDLNPVEIGQADVEAHQFGPGPRDRVENLAAGIALRDRLNLTVREERAQVPAGAGFVVHNDRAHGGRRDHGTTPNVRRGA